jgi:hypothetical protein
MLSRKCSSFLVGGSVRPRLLLGWTASSACNSLSVSHVAGFQLRTARRFASSTPPPQQPHSNDSVKDTNSKVRSQAQRVEPTAREVAQEAEKYYMKYLQFMGTIATVTSFIHAFTRLVQLALMVAGLVVLYKIYQLAAAQALEYKAKAEAAQAAASAMAAMAAEKTRDAHARGKDTADAISERGKLVLEAARDRAAEALGHPSADAGGSVGEDGKPTAAELAALARDKGVDAFERAKERATSLAHDEELRAELQERARAASAAGASGLKQAVAELRDGHGDGDGTAGDLRARLGSATSHLWGAASAVAAEGRNAAAALKEKQN